MTLVGEKMDRVPKTRTVKRIYQKSDGNRFKVRKCILRR